MAKKRFDVEVPDGQHLGISRDTNGAYRAHLFDDETNDLVGHAELFEPPEDDSSSPDIEYVYVSSLGAADEPPHQLSAEELAEFVNLVMTAAVAAAPHIRRWWTDTVVPTFKAACAGRRIFTRVPHRREDHGPSRARGTASMVGPAPVQSNSELSVAFHDDRIRMSSVEARERFVAALLAREFSDAQMKILQHSQIEEEEGLVELERAIGALTPQDVVQTLEGILERKPSLLDHLTLTELGAIRGGGRAEGAYVPVKIEQFRAAPRTMDRHRES